MNSYISNSNEKLKFFHNFFDCYAISYVYYIDNLDFNQ